MRQIDRIRARVRPEDLPEGVRFTRRERESLRRLYRRGNLAERRYCLDVLSAGKHVAANRRFALEMIDEMIPDRSTYVRWQSLIALEAIYVEHPAEVWPLVVKWGTQGTDDIRAGVACCTLEHLLERHFSEFFPRAVRHAEKNRRFAKTLSACWKFGEARKPKNARLFDREVERLRSRFRGSR
jgi:hypothetical protein